MSDGQDTTGGGQDIRAGGGAALQRPVADFIPHRDPFLFVTRVVEHDGESIVTEWDVPEDLAAFEGHFPGNPVLPGVLISEFCFQSGAILISALGADGGVAEGVPVLTRITDARFKRMVRPGETIRAEVERTEQLSNAHFMKARVTCDGKVVVRLECVLALAAAGGA